MTWRIRHGVRVWVGTPLALDEYELAQYAFCATPVAQRVNPGTCGKPGTGRNAHRRRGEPTCPDCHAAERVYKAGRREAGVDA